MLKLKHALLKVTDRSLSRRRRILLTSVALLLLGALAISGKALVRHAQRARLLNFAAPTSAPQQMETVTVRLEQSGFAPASLRRAAGGFLLAIDNQSGAAELNLKVTRDGQSGTPALEYRVPAGASDFSQEIDLPAGAYTLMEVNHPVWIFHITVQ